MVQKQKFQKKANNKKQIKTDLHDNDQKVDKRQQKNKANKQSITYYLSLAKNKLKQKQGKAITRNKSS